jgi:coenzyme PQQ precursor peptide PqqA
VVLGGVISRMKAIKTLFWRNVMKIWNKPQVREQAVGMEVTAYLPAGIDLI